MKVYCWVGEHEIESGLSNDGLGWHGCCKDCNSSFDVDIEEYLVSNGTKVKFADGRIGIVDGNDNEDTEEFDDINYYVCPIEFTSEKYWSNHYVMLLREDFEIVED